MGASGSGHVAKLMNTDALGDIAGGVRIHDQTREAT
jgi:hypothetical protein